jgi:hypothetical protein
MTSLARVAHRRCFAIVALAATMPLVWGGAIVRAEEPPAPANTTKGVEDLPELVLYLKDGRRISGYVQRQNAQEIVLLISGISTRFATADIERFEALPSIFERYRSLREAVGDDPDQIVKLAQWLQSKERLELAYAEILRALKADPTHPEATRLKTLLEAQIELRAKRQTRPAGEEEGPETARPAGPVPRVDFPLLTPEQVNLMKVYEVDLNANPRLIIPRETIRRMLDKHSTHPLVPITREGREAIERKSPAEILDLMFRLQAREFYKDVQVVDPPPAFTTFRDQVARTWLLNSCATNQCHGGMEAGRLVLFNRRPNAEQSLYTNFLILSRFHLEDGTPLIDFQVPERSPLLQMGLPRERSRFPHPKVYRGVNARDAFRPVFQSPEDRAFQAGVEWIKSLYKPRPEYPIEYEALRPLRVAPKDRTPQPPQEPGPTAPDAAPATIGRSPKPEPDR